MPPQAYVSSGRAASRRCSRMANRRRRPPPPSVGQYMAQVKPSVTGVKSRRPWREPTAAEASSSLEKSSVSARRPQLTIWHVHAVGVHSHIATSVLPSKQEKSTVRVGAKARRFEASVSRLHPLPATSSHRTRNAVSVTACTSAPRRMTAGATICGDGRHGGRRVTRVSVARAGSSVTSRGVCAGVSVRGRVRAAYRRRPRDNESNDRSGQAQLLEYRNEISDHLLDSFDNNDCRADCR